MTAWSGGLSKITRSASSFKRASTVCIRWEPSSSAGLGGNGPVVRTRRFACSVTWDTDVQVTVSFRSIVVRPWALGRLKITWTAGLPQVRVDEQDTTPGLGEHDGDIGRRDGLALVRDGARDKEGVQRGIDGGELDIRPERAIPLGDARSGIEEGGEPIDLALSSIAPHPR